MRFILLSVFFLLLQLVIGNAVGQEISKNKKDTSGIFQTLQKMRSKSNGKSQNEKVRKRDTSSVINTIEKMRNPALDTAKTDSIKIEEEEKPIFSDTYYDWAAYGGYQTSLFPHPESLEPGTTFLLGFQYGKPFMEISFTENNGTYSYPIIFPNEFNLDYVYLQGLLGIQFINRRFYEASLTGAFGHGDIVWESKEGGQDLFRDKFNVLKAGLRAEFTPKKFVAVFATVGYQSMLNINIEQLSNKDMSGLYLGAGIKFGYYKMTKL